MRRHRRASNSFSTGSAGSYQRKRSNDDTNSQRSCSPRSNSPGDESISDEMFTGLIINSVEDDGLLKPPMRMVSTRSYWRKCSVWFWLFCLQCAGCQYGFHFYCLNFMVLWVCIYLHCIALWYIFRVKCTPSVNLCHFEHKIFIASYIIVSKRPARTILSKTFKYC